MITYSKRLEKVHRVFDPYHDRTGYVRLDRNEDPVGYDVNFFNQWKSQLTVHDVAAYADSAILTGKLANWLGVDKQQIYISSGSDALIKTIFETYVDSNDIVLTQKPNWRMYDVYMDIYGANPEYIYYDERFDFDINGLVDKVKVGNIRMVILANPNQPTGTLIKIENIEKLLTIADKKGTLVVIDEAYHLFSDTTVVELTKKYKNLIVVRTFSKAFGLAGLRIGYVVADPVRIQEVMLLRPVTDANSLALNFAGYLLDNIDVVVNKIDDFNRGRDYLYDQLKRSGIKCQQSHTNFILIPCPNEESAKHIMSFAKIKKYLLKGPFKEKPLNNYVRITTGPLELMKSFWTDCGAYILEHASKTSGGNLEIE